MDDAGDTATPPAAWQMTLADVSDAAAGTMAAYPELTNCIVTAFLWSLGDLLAQWLESYSSRRSGHLPLPQHSLSPSHSGYAPPRFRWNAWRTARLALFAGLIFAPCTKAWFELLVLMFPGEGLVVALQRMAADQLLYAACVLSALFTWMALTESGCDGRAVRAKIRANFWPALKSNWMLWPAAQLFIQGVVPLAYRMLVAAIINVPWSAYLAWRSSSKPPPTNLSPRELSLGKI